MDNSEKLAFSSKIEEVLADTSIVGFAGDWHGNIKHALSALELFSVNDVQVIFQLGDFGLFGSLLEHSTDKFRHRINRSLEANNQYLFVTLGNHENYDLLEKIPTITEGFLAGFKQESKAPRILYFARGQSLKVGGRNFLSCGGAASIDFKWRWAYEAQRGGRKVWWAQETITIDDIQTTIAEAKKLETVDIFLAHDVFASAEILGTHRQDVSSWTYDELEFAQVSRDALEKIARNVLPTFWFHGHYHMPIVLQTEMKGVRAVKNASGKISVEKKTIESICLAKDDEKKSSGVLFLDELVFSFI